MRTSMEPLACNKSRLGEGGYMLLETAIALAALGFITTGFLQFQKHFSERESFIETNHKIEVIADALSTHAQMRWRLPCPAAPIKPAGAAFGTERASCANAGEEIGILPYRSLGLPEQYAKDNYGHFFTYVVSPAFTRRNRVIDTATDKYHARLAHYVTTNNIGFLPKAQFCGALDQDAGGNAVTAATDISVQLQGNAIALGARNETYLTGVTANPPDPNYYRTLNVSAFATAIVSHGPNGFGAYLENNSGNRNLTAANFGTSENNTVTVARLVAMEREIRRANGVTYFDDIVTTFTQDQILAEAGGGSCELP